MCKGLGTGEQSKKNGVVHWNMAISFSWCLNPLSGNRKIHRGVTGNGKSCVEKEGPKYIDQEREENWYKVELIC